MSLFSTITGFSLAMLILGVIYYVFVALLKFLEKFEILNDDDAFLT